MDLDFQPAKRSAKSLQVALDESTKTDKVTPVKTETFRTPAEMAVEQVVVPLSEETTEAAPQTQSRLTAWRKKLHIGWPPGNKEWAATLIIVAVGGLGIFAVASHHGSKPIAAAQPAKIAKPAPKSSMIPSTLSGLLVDPAVNNRPVTGVMIENSTDARPQSGLGQASVVFEAIAEGGITRFLALFQDTAPDDVGPIRSARPYYEQWALGFDAGYAHVGGSPEALAAIKAWGVRDLDQFANGGSYHRVSNRAAPHNVYTGIGTLNQLEASKGYTSSKFTGFARKASETPAKLPTAKSIDLKISGPLYNVHYDYVPSTNSYARSEGGAPQMEAINNTQLSPKVIVALVMPYSLAADGYHSDYATIGSGPVNIFQDGGIITGQWTKASPTSQFVFTDDAGKPIKLNPGQTWLTAMAAAGNISYAP